MMDRRLARIRRAYGRSPRGYDRGMALFERLVARARRRIGELARGRVLEIGIGTGATLAVYAPEVQVVGVDLSRPMLEACRDRAAALRREVALVELDAARLPFADAVFDSVVFTLCLCTIPDPGAALREALRVARPGAPILLLEHVRSHLPPVAWLQEAMTLLSGPLSEEYFNRRTAETARRAGVEVVRLRRWGLGFFNFVEGRRPAP